MKFLISTILDVRQHFGLPGYAECHGSMDNITKSLLI